MVIVEELRARIDAVCASYPERRGGLLPALHLVQERTGWISRDVALEVAEIFDIRPNEVMEVVSFYNMVHARPVGRHCVNVCTNLSCALRGSRRLLAQLGEHLGVAPGQTTSDGRITLGHEECLGGCAGAPVMRIGDTYHEDLDLESATAIVDGLE